MDFETAVTYRMAYGLAHALAEGAEQNHPGRHRSNAAAGGTAGVILAEVVRRLGGGQGTDADVIREGVEDALAGRRPRW